MMSVKFLVPATVVAAIILFGSVMMLPIEAAETCHTSGEYTRVQMDHELSVYDLVSGDMAEYHPGDVLGDSSVLVIDSGDVSLHAALVRTLVLDGHMVATVNSGGHVFDALVDDLPLAFDYGSFLNMMYIAGGVTYCYSNTSDGSDQSFADLAFFLGRTGLGGPGILQANNCRIDLVSVSDLHFSATGWARTYVVGGQWHHHHQLMCDVEGKEYNGTVSDGYFSITNVSVLADGSGRRLASAECLEMLSYRDDPHLLADQRYMTNLCWDDQFMAWDQMGMIRWGLHLTENYEYTYNGFREAAIDCSVKVSGLNHASFGHTGTIIPGGSDDPDFDGSIRAVTHVVDRDGGSRSGLISSIERSQHFR